MDLTYRSGTQLITVKQNGFPGPSYTMASYQQDANSYTTSTSWHVNAQDLEQHAQQQYYHQHHAPTQMMDVNSPWSY